MVRAPAAVAAGGRRAVFLDRDGVLSIPLFRDGRSYAPQRLDDFKLYPDAADAVAGLKAQGFLIIVATNQPDVGAGLVHGDVIAAMHTKLMHLVRIDDIETCFETRAQATIRRKPGPGMLFDAAAKWSIDLERSYMVGDRSSDIEAGRAAGCAAIFVDRGYTAEPQPTGQRVTVGSLGEAVFWILSQNDAREIRS